MNCAGESDVHLGIKCALQLQPRPKVLTIESRIRPPPEKPKDRRQRVVYPMLKAKTTNIFLPETQILATDRGVRDRNGDYGADNQQIPTRFFRVEKPVECI